MKKIELKYKKLNLGCGNDYKKGWINLDNNRNVKADVYHDLNKFPWPFPDNSFDEVYASHILEHLNDPFKAMRELWRICKPKAIIEIKTPHFSSNNVFGDIQHKRGFNLDTFKNQNLSNMFKVVQEKLTFSRLQIFGKFLYKINPSFYEKYFSYIFPAVDLHVKLEVKK